MLVCAVGQRQYRRVDEVSGDGTDNGIRHGITEPAHRGEERTALLGFLQRQRELVAWKVHDVTDEVLRSVTTPSGLTLHGVVRHLINVERSWVRDVFAGHDDLTFDWTEDDPDGELHVPEDVTMADLLADYAAEAQHCDAVVAAAASLDVVSPNAASPCGGSCCT